MDSKKYLNDSERTVSADYQAIINRASTKQGVDLIHAALGMQTEVAEFSDMIRKSLFYGKPLDVVNLKEEIGDALWYMALALRALNSDFESVMERNIEKLKARYPQKFTEELAENRDLAKERDILENE